MTKKKNHWDCICTFIIIMSLVTAVPLRNWSFLHSISLSHCGSWQIRPDFGTSLWSSSWCSKTVYANWSSPVLHHMNHTFPLLPIFTAAVHLDLLKRFTPRWLRKTRNPECSRLRFSHSLRLHKQPPTIPSWPSNACKHSCPQMSLCMLMSLKENLIWEWASSVFLLWLGQLT